MNEENIAKILQNITGLKDDHDLLVRISTSLEQLNKSQKEERERTVVSIAKIESSVLAAHTRIDGIVKFHWMALGAFTTITVTIALATFVLKVSGKI